ASPTTWSRRSSKVSWPSGGRKSPCSINSTSTPRSTTRSRSRSCARSWRRRPARTSALLASPTSASANKLAAMAADPQFKRLLLKLSGEALMGDLAYGTDAGEVTQIAEQIARVRERGVEVAIVVGAGNIYRGLSAAAEGMDRATGDYMGMLATV